MADVGAEADAGVTRPRGGISAPWVEAWGVPDRLGMTTDVIPGDKSGKNTVKLDPHPSIEPG